MFLKTYFRVSSLMTRIASRIFVFNLLVVCAGSVYIIYSTLYVPRDSSHRESILLSAQAIKSVHLFPSILQEAFYPIFSYFIGRVRRRSILLEDHFFWIFSKLGKQKIPMRSFVPTSCHISVFKKVRPDNLLFRQGTPYVN